MVARLQEVAGALGGIERGRVLEVSGDGFVLAEVDGQVRTLRCAVLRVSESRALQLASGDDVLIWRPTAETEQPVILGRIGLAVDPAAGVSPIPDEILIEANRGLTLKVGEGSITLRADGKILIQGKDLVSHAKRMNRIKGGAVSIN